MDPDAVEGGGVGILVVLDGGGGGGVKGGDGVGNLGRKVIEYN